MQRRYLPFPKAESHKNYPASATKGWASLDNGSTFTDEGSSPMVGGVFFRLFRCFILEGPLMAKISDGK